MVNMSLCPDHILVIVLTEPPRIIYVYSKEGDRHNWLDLALGLVIVRYYSREFLDLRIVRLGDVQL
jgi:hypothetical protein